MKTWPAFFERLWIRGVLQYVLFVIATLLAVGDLLAGCHGQPQVLPPPPARSSRGGDPAERVAPATELFGRELFRRVPY